MEETRDGSQKLRTSSHGAASLCPLTENSPLHTTKHNICCVGISQMPTLKINRRHRTRVRVQLTVFGYEVQVYGQTVFRSSTQDEAERLARDLCRALG